MRRSVSLTVTAVMATTLVAMAAPAFVRGWCIGPMPEDVGSLCTTGAVAPYRHYNQTPLANERSGLDVYHYKDNIHGSGDPCIQNCILGEMPQIGCDLK